MLDGGSVGRLRVENFHVVAQKLDEGTCKLETSNTVEMNPRQPCAVDPLEPVHRVYNPGEFNQRAVSLHVYSRPFDTCVVYSPEQGTCGVIKLHYKPSTANRPGTKVRRTRYLKAELRTRAGYDTCKCPAKLTFPPKKNIFHHTAEKAKPAASLPRNPSRTTAAASS